MKAIQNFFLFILASIVGITFPVLADTPFGTGFDPVAGPLSGINRNDVKAQLGASLYSEASALDYVNSWLNGYACRIVFEVDERTGLLTVFHYEGNSAEPHYVFNGGCESCADGFSLSSPKDVSHYTFFLTGGHGFFHNIYIADTANSRIARLIYNTHRYNSGGYRLDDNFQFISSIGEGILSKPTGVDAAGSDLYVADQGTSQLYRFDEYEVLLQTIDAQTLLVPEFSPYKVASSRQGGQDVVLVLSERPFELPNQTHDNLFFISSNGTSANVIRGFRLDGVRDLSYSDKLGFIVLTDDLRLVQYGVDGNQVFSYTLADRGPSVSYATSLSLYEDYIALAFDYDSDSGISLFRKNGGVGGTELAKFSYFNKFEPVSFSVKIVEEGNFNCFVREKNSIDEEYLWSGEWKAPGLYEMIWNCFDCSEGIYEVVVDDVQKNQTLSVEEFELNHGPKIEISTPVSSQEFFDGERVDLNYNIQFTTEATIDSTVLYLGKHNHPPIERNKIKPGDQDERGDIFFKFTIPVLGEVGCGYEYNLELWSYFQVGQYIRKTVTYLDPGIIVYCSNEPDNDRGTPCNAPCFTSDGKVWLPGGKNIFVRAVNHGTQIECYVKGAEFSDLSIYDLRGRLIGKREVNSSIEGIPGRIISTSDLRLSSGVYFAKVGRGSVNVAKFVIVK